MGTFHSQHFREGLWGIYCGTSKESFEQALKLAFETLDETLNSAPPEKEVEQSKSGLCGSMELSMESSMRRAGFNAKSLLYYGKLRDWQDEVKKIETVEADSVWRNIRALWRAKRPVITSLGDLDKDKIENDLLKSFQKSIIT